MTKFDFTFLYDGREHEAECQAFPLDGTTELHITPHDPALFNAFGIKLLLRSADGSVSAVYPASHEADYVLALADGVAAYFDNEQRTISQ